jgi:hypothetical protein
MSYVDIIKVKLGTCSNYPELNTALLKSNGSSYLFIQPSSFLLFISALLIARAAPPVTFSRN